MKKETIFIATGIYPPNVGGPAKYAEMLLNSFSEKGHKVLVESFSTLLYIPTGIRHIVYFLKIIIGIAKSDFVIALDTFSVCLPAMIASKICLKKIIVRTGGDFLWESYLERKREAIKLSDFYNQKRDFSFKEKVIFIITRFLLQNVDMVVFSTQTQRDIFIKAYNLDYSKTSIIENLYLQNKKRNIVPKEKIIFSPARNIFLKNKDGLQMAVNNLQKRFIDLKLDTKIAVGDSFEKKLLESYILVVPSISEISPNIVLEALSFGIPTVLTEDSFIKDRVGDFVVFVNPLDISSIESGIEKLLDARVYSEYMAKISGFNFVHSGDDITTEFLDIFRNLKK